MFKIKIADLVVEINNKFDFVKKVCKDYIVDENTKSDFSVCVTQEELEKDKKTANGNFSDGYVESVCVYRNICKKIPDFDAFLLHAAVVKVDDKAYAFTARNKKKKTTHIKLWKELLGEKALIINGDKPIIKIVDGKPLIYGTPWCGKEGYNINDCAELKSICFIERSDINSIEPFEMQFAVQKIVKQLIIPDNPESVAKLLELLDITLKKVDVWKLKCNMDISAAKMSYKTMKDGINNEN